MHIIKEENCISARGTQFSFLQVYYFSNMDVYSAASASRAAVVR